MDVAIKAISTEFHDPEALRQVSWAKELFPISNGQWRAMGWDDAGLDVRPVKAVSIRQGGKRWASPATRCVN
jgi:hypothetical protein